MDEIKEVAIQIYRKLVEEGIDSAASVMNEYLEKEKTEKLKLTKTPVLIKIGNEVGRLLENNDWKFDMLLELWEKGGRDERLIAIGALSRISRKDYKNSLKFVMDVAPSISDWEICDQLALRVVVNLAVHDPEEMFSVMCGWVEADDKWIRRLAIATIPPYIRARPDDAESCLKLVEKVMTDRDRDVKKAAGWALREISKKDQRSVFEFLMKWTENAGKDTKRIIRDGMKKLSAEHRERIESLLAR